MDATQQGCMHTLNTRGRPNDTRGFKLLYSHSWHAMTTHCLHGQALHGQVGIVSLRILLALHKCPVSHSIQRA